MVSPLQHLELESNLFMLARQRLARLDVVSPKLELGVAGQDLVESVVADVSAVTALDIAATLVDAEVTGVVAAAAEASWGFLVVFPESCSMWPIL